MTITREKQNRVSWALACGVAVPIIYFGVQLIAAPLYPEYSFATDDASTLGSTDSKFPALFNVSMLIMGVLMMASSVGLLRSFREFGCRVWLTWPIVLAVACGGLGSINAGVFPLPDERHVSGLLAQVGAILFFLPVLLPFAFWSDADSRRLRVFLWINLAIQLGLIPIISGLIQRAELLGGESAQLYQDFLNNWFGILQRVTAAVVFVPLGLVCWHFLKTADRSVGHEVSGSSG